MFDHGTLQQVSEVTKTGPSPEVIVPRSTFRKNGEMTNMRRLPIKLGWCFFRFIFFEASGLIELTWKDLALVRTNVCVTVRAAALLISGA